MLKNLLTGAAVVALTTSVGLAQTSQTPPVSQPVETMPSTTAPSNTAPGTMNQAPRVPSTGTTAAGSAISFMTQQTGDQWLVTNFVNRSVYGQDGASIGDINDLLIDKNGSIQAVIVGVGGFLGIGEKDVALPFTAIELMRDPAATSEDRSVRLTVRATREDLRAAPAFVEYDWRANRANTAPRTTGTTGNTGMTGSSTTAPNSTTVPPVTR